MVAPSVMILPAFTSMLSGILLKVSVFPVILITGAMGLPVGVPRPVENTMAVAPPATMPVMESMSWPGVSIKYRPFLSRGSSSEYSRAPWNGAVFPALYMQPRDFSSMVDRPPALFPGVGWPVRRSSPSFRARSSTLWTMVRNFSRWAGSPNRSARICSAPMTSVVSLRMLLPPKETSLSDTYPMVGLEASPLVGSDPPHSMPRTISLISPSVRTSVDSLAAMAQAISPPLAMAFRVPPQPWMVMASTGFPVTAIRLASSLAWIPSQPSPTTRTAPTLAFFPKPSRVRSVCSWSEPIWQQPCWLGTAMAPGT